ncbi:thiol reductant ABC exporter subunit CydD [Bombilactobacillus folatiphilus]|uniref:Thiol reductant ABC exporter subunit CydD n=1 Tax=Bombilactobacillus folatiphilus TaxID=2923362 RepID=A0ABY4P948_9LACO|nr:thiol reductant ABC exporter subunit CydD [Bombilactobacillus folatiphilus]UQS82147.1 thiol reductant ABC exporter subunit CydD [Bombilactobacillus folatiphilus]
MIDKQLFQLPKIKSLFKMLAGLTILQAFMILLQASFLTKALVISWKQLALHNILWPTVGFLAAFLSRHFINWLKDIMLDRFATQTTEDLRNQVLHKIYQSGSQIVAHTGSGNLVTETLDGMDQVNNYLNLILSKFMNMMIIPWIILVFVFWQNRTSGIILILVFPVIILFMIILGYAAQDKSEDQYAQYVVLSNHFLDALRGLTTLKMLGLSKEYAHNVQTVSENYRKKTMSTLTIAILSTFALDWFTTLSIALLAVFLGLALIKGTIPLTPALVTLILAPEYFLPLRNFANDYHATLDGKNAFTAAMDLLNQPTVKNQQRLAPFTWQQDSRLQLKQLAFQYESDQANLQDLNLKISGYQKIAIIGQSGAGKTTLLDLLSGFLVPKSGKIQLNNHQLPHLAQTNWQKQIAYLPQKPYLFSKTIANNIRFYQPNATDDQVKMAVQQAGLTEFINHLPTGLETKVGEGGRGISGGQAQRIMLARAFLAQERRVLLLDEPTAHLDIETEYNLKQTMLPLFENHLVIFATHRLHWLNQMDYVVVLDRGKIVEQGSLKQLQQETSGPFYDLTFHMRGEQNVEA